MYKLIRKGIVYGVLLYLAYDAMVGVALLNYDFEGEVIPCELSEYSKEILEVE